MCLPMDGFEIPVAENELVFSRSFAYSDQDEPQEQKPQCSRLLKNQNRQKKNLLLLLSCRKIFLQMLKFI